MALFDDVKAVIVQQLGVNADEVKENSNFIDDLNADSLDVVEMIMALEEKFSIEIPDQDAEAIKTVKDVVDYIEKAKKQHSQILFQRESAFQIFHKITQGEYVRRVVVTGLGMINSLGLNRGDSFKAIVEATK